VWLEICELAPSGEYIPVSVEADEESACRGSFLLQQGIQRRIRITLIHEYDPDVQFKEIRELVVGRVRSDAEVDFDDEEDLSILSLSLFPGEFLPPIDNRVVFQIEAAWDTSLHNNVLLNRVTPSGERVYLTLSAYIDMEKCTQPVVVTKDICLIMYGRDARIFPRSNARTFKQLFNFRQETLSRSSGVFELILRRVIDTASPGVERRQRKVLDTSSMYVRGEENLIGWQPRGDSLIFEHQWELEKITRVELVERIRHILAVKDALKNQDSHFAKLNMSSSRMNLAALTSPPSPTQSANPSDDAFIAFDDREKEICRRVLSFIQNTVPNKNLCQLQDPSENNTRRDPSNHSSPKDNSPDKPSGTLPPSRPRTGILSDVSKKMLFTPEMEEVLLNPTTSRKGELQVMDEKTNKWSKHWLVVRRPYLFMFKDEKDTIERAVINLTDAQVDFCVEEDAHESSLVFSVTTKNREYWFKASSGKEVHDWLYAINPLLAGEILSKLSRARRDSL